MDVFSLIALIANILFLGVNLWLLVRHRREDRAAGDILAREDRIERVVVEYLRLSTVHPIQDSGIHALIVSGVKGLPTSEEIDDALQRIMDRTGTHPLGNDARKLPLASLKEFLTGVTVQGRNTVGYREALAKFGARQTHRAVYASGRTDQDQQSHPRS